MDEKQDEDWACDVLMAAAKSPVQMHMCFAEGVDNDECTECQEDLRQRQGLVGL